MKNFLTCVFVLLFLNACSGSQWVVLEWKFKGIEPGYDHPNRSKVTVDGVDLPASDSCRQSSGGTYSLKLSKTVHRIRLVNEAYYKGRWVEHTFENGFSINAICEFEVNAKEVSKVLIEFNLNNSECSIVRFGPDGNKLSKKNPVFKGKHYPMTVDWKFINVEKGYDHPSRMLVFVDDMEYGSSVQSVESTGGNFTINIPKGQHRVRIVNQSFVKGVWQDHKIINNYSLDAVFEKSLNVRKAVRVTLVIDLNNEQTVNRWE
ncbi:hypothetical protein [Fluviicola sp.]|uniref:hypothetical protein n=1 Tax=Fluviicola sp. TaxID=1917219 RepID=UPI0031DF8718